MKASHHNKEGLARGARMLRTALGPAIARFLEDAAVIEVMLNPDGRIWLDRLDVAPSFYPAVSSFRRLDLPSRAG